jgi:hypothetical protein
MLTPTVNATCINNSFSVGQSGMDKSLDRLLECAATATRLKRSPVKVVGDLKAAMKVSSAVLTNWKERGVAAPGALKAERLFGCSAIWVLEGTGSQWLASRFDKGDPEVQMDESDQLRHALALIVNATKSATKHRRPDIAESLAKLVLQPARFHEIADDICRWVNPPRAHTTGVDYSGGQVTISNLDVPTERIHNDGKDLQLPGSGEGS